MSKILVTGGLGYIGSHTVVELLQAGFEVVVIDNLCNSKIEVKTRIEAISGKSFVLIQEDVSNTEALKSIFASHHIAGIIHFAAHKDVGESVKHPTEYYRNNIGGLVSLLSAISLNRKVSLIFSSSCTVYGTASTFPVTEKTLIQEADSPYGATKIIGEQLINDFAKHTDLKVIHLRYFNPVGAHPSAKIGLLPIGVPNNLIPYVTQTAAGIRKSLTIHGNDYNTHDGTCIRDYVHVVDLAKAHVKALAYAFELGTQVDVFNIGTGKGSSVLDVLNAFKNVNNVDVPHSIGPRRPGDVEEIWGTVEKANSILGWKPTYSLEDMMKHAWAWQQGLKD